MEAEISGRVSIWLVESCNRFNCCYSLEIICLTDYKSNNPLFEPPDGSTLMAEFDLSLLQGITSSVGHGSNPSDVALK